VSPLGRPSKYTEEFRRDAVGLVRSSGRPINEVARDLGLSHETLRNWVRKRERGLMVDASLPVCRWRIWTRRSHDCASRWRNCRSTAEDCVGQRCAYPPRREPSRPRGRHDGAGRPEQEQLGRDGIPAFSGRSGRRHSRPHRPRRRDGCRTYGAAPVGSRSSSQLSAQCQVNECPHR
jgi:transposase-like protein